MKKVVLIAVICFFLFSSESNHLHTILQSGIATDEKIELKYPIVLVHGIARNDKGRHFQPWGRIPRVLRENGIEVYFGNTDAWGNIISNAELLKATIDSILENTKHERVNIIAHSKGGIDSRYLIWKYDYGDKVASLTTVSTPHGGAEIADFFFNSSIIHTESARKQLRAAGRAFGDVHPDMYSVNQNLTTENMGVFNKIVTRDARVYYQVIYSVMNDPADDPIFFFSYTHIKNISGENDGLVSEKSARWGSNPIKLAASISHDQIIDQGREKFPGMEIPIIYLEIIRDLAGKGF